MIMKKNKIKKRLLTTAIVTGAIGFTAINVIPTVSVNAATVFVINNETEYKNAEGALNRLKKIYGNDINTWPEPSKSEGKAYEAAMNLYRIQNGSNNDDGNNGGGNNVPTYSTVYKNKYNATINYYLNDNIIATKKFENVDSSFVGNNLYDDNTNQYLLEDKPAVVGNEIIGWYIPLISNDVIGEKIGQYTTINYAERQKIITRTYKATVNAEPIYKYRTVTFTDENGNVLKTQRVEYGEELQAPEVEERESQNFNGWSIDLESARYTAGDVTIKETWKDKKQYTVRFYDDDYKTLIKEEIVYEGGTANPPVVEREGYKFKYWSRVGGVSNSLENIRENAFFRAVYEKLYLVVFTDGFGNVLSKEYVENGTSVEEPDESELPKKRGYRFNGWSGNADIITEDMTIDAQWQKLQLHTIIFEDENGNVIKKEKIYSGESIESPDTPKRDGVVFDYWVDKDTGRKWYDYDVAYEDHVYVPVYRDYAKVKFYKGRDYNWVISKQEIGYGKSASAPENPDKYGYTFIGWDKEFDVVTEDLDIYPLWEKKEYTVTFEDGFGNVIKTEKVKYEESIKIPEIPTKEGYIFEDWIGIDEDGRSWHMNGGTGDDLEIGNNVVFTANWKKKEYTVEFNDGNGNTLKTQSVEYGESAVAPAKPYRDKHIFKGWDKDFSNVSENLIVTALWEAEKYNVTFEDGDGNILKEETVLYGESATPPKEPARTGFTFTEWDTSYENVESDLTVKALWKRNEYKVEFTDGNGNIIDTQTIEHGKSASAPSAPERYQYIFKGWDKDFSNVTDNMTVTALWEKEQYTVTFEDGNGNVLKKEKVLRDESATAPKKPVREGFTFKGWDNSFSSVSGDLLVKAMWETVQEQPSDEPGNSGEQEKPSDEPGNSGEQEQPSDETGNSGEQEQPSDEPGNSGEQEQPSDEPDNQGEQEQPADEPKNNGEQEMPADEPGNSGEQEQPADESGNQGEQEQPAEDPGNSGEQEQPADESGNSGEQEQPVDEPDNNGEQEQPAEDPGNHGEQERPVNEPDNQGEQEQPTDEPDNSGKQEQPKDDSANEQDSGKTTGNDNRTENTNQASSGNETGKQAENNVSVPTTIGSATVQKTAGSGNASVSVVANSGGAVTTAPKTADTNSVGLWSALATGAVAVAGAVIFKKRKKED